MIELQPADYVQVAPNIAEFVSFDSLKSSTLERKQPGRVFAGDGCFVLLHVSNFCFVHLDDADRVPPGLPDLLLRLKSEREWMGVLLSPAVAADGKVELAVATDERYRRRGLAAVVSAAAVDHCLRRHLLPEWSCHADNAASVRLATKLGFVRGAEYPVFTPA